jgi:hypothetical protein
MPKIGNARRSDDTDRAMNLLREKCATFVDLKQFAFEPFQLAMTLNTLTLPSTAMKNLARQSSERAFDWIVGSTRFRSTWMCAEVWCPKIAKLRAIDPSITEYIVETPDAKNEFHIFLEISEGYEVRLDKSNSEFLLNLFREFENLDQYWTLHHTFGEELRISQDERLSPELLNPECEQGIKHLASNFWQLTPEHFNQIPLTTLALVLSHESLLISSEDLLYRFISDQIPTNPDYFQFLRFVRFDCLSGASIANFIRLSEDYFVLIDLDLWKVICRRLEVDPGSDCETERTKEVYRPLDERDRPDGIFSYLSRGWGILSGIDLLKVTMKSVYNDGDPEIAAARIVHRRTFFSKDEPNQWVCWELKFHCTRPTHYSFYSHAKSWIVEGSMDGIHWWEIDRQTDAELTGRARCFDVSQSLDCKFIRLTQTDKCEFSNDRLTFIHFEVFGSVWLPRN